MDTHSLQAVDTVYILGAGASCDVGCPLSKDFLYRMEELLPDFDQETHASALRILNAHRQLQHSQSYAKLVLPDIETIFSAIETGSLLRSLGSLPMEDVQQLPADMRRVIVGTITRSMPFKLVPEGYGLKIDGAYSKFVVHTIRECFIARKRRATIITFNYDVALEYFLYTHKVNFDYCLEGTLNPELVNVLKLHGSINWFQCPNPECAKLHPYPVGKRLGDTRTIRSDQTHLSLDFPPPKARCDCGSFMGNSPVLVPPTWAKLEHQRRTAPVWRAACAAIASASKIVVIGYSLPDSDQFFRHLLALGLLGNDNNRLFRRFLVVNPDGSVGAAFENILGTSLRSTYQFHQDTFATANMSPNVQQPFIAVL